MIFKNAAEVSNAIKDNLSVNAFFTKARDEKKVLAALINGDNFINLLINKIEKLESEDIAVVRRKYSKDIKDLFHRVFLQRNNVFKPNGGSIENNLKGKSKETITNILYKFKGQENIKQYFADNFFKLMDIDPNGLMFLEYINNEKIYPTYKSINDIRFYKRNGQLLEYVIFEPKKIKIGNNYALEWRVVDDRFDYIFTQIGDSFILQKEKTFKHPFSNVPAIILSSNYNYENDIRLSSINNVISLAEDYARDKSVLTSYKFQHGFPRHYKYEDFCRKCQGAGKIKGDICGSCKGLGYNRINDVTDVTILKTPREGQPILTPNIEGFSSPDLETWGKYTETLRETEDKIDSTIWGTKNIYKNTKNETATGRFIDVQPIDNQLNYFANQYEFSINIIIGFVEDWINGSPKETKEYHVNIGRRFIIESADVLTDKYLKAVAAGTNSIILDKMLDEIIYSKNQNNTKTLERIALIKRKIEPYIHVSLKDVFTIFGADEANKKVLFVEFWQNVDKNKDENTLKKEFEKFVDKNKLIIKK